VATESSSNVCTHTSPCNRKIQRICHEIHDPVWRGLGVGGATAAVCPPPPHPMAIPLLLHSVGWQMSAGQKAVLSGRERNCMPGHAPHSPPTISGLRMSVHITSSNKYGTLCFLHRQGSLYTVAAVPSETVKTTQTNVNISAQPKVFRVYTFKHVKHICG